MKKIISFLCVLTLLFSSVSTAFACSTCQANVENNAEKIYITRGLTAQKNCTDNTDSKTLSLRNQNTSSYPNDGSRIFSIIELNAASVTDASKIKKVKLHIWKSSTPKVPVFLAAFAVNDGFTYPSSANALGEQYSFDTIGDFPLDETPLCSDPNCSHGTVESYSDIEYCSGIIKANNTQQFEELTLDVTNYVKTKLETTTNILIGLDSPYNVSSNSAKEQNVGATSGNATLNFAAPSHNGTQYHPYVEITYISSDATLKSASLEGGTFDKAFSPDIESYEVTFPYTQTNLPHLVYEINDPKASLESLVPATEFGGITTIKIKAEDGTINTYTFKIIKEAPPAPEQSKGEWEVEHTTRTLVDSADVRLKPEEIPYTTINVIQDAGTASTNIYTVLKLDISNMKEPHLVESVKLSIRTINVGTGAFLGLYKTDNKKWGTEQDRVPGKSIGNDVGPSLTERICNVEGCTHGAVDSVDDTDYCKSIINLKKDVTYELDITEYVKEMLEEGREIINVGIKQELVGERSISQSTIASVAPKTSGTEPTFTIKYYPESNDATIKDVSFYNGILDKTFKGDILNYDVGLNDNMTPFPTINFNLSNPHARILSQVDGNAFGESTVVTIKAEDGTTKTYTFTFKKMSDMGFSTDGKVKVDSIKILNGANEVTSLPYGSMVYITADVRNDNTQNKNAVLIAVIKESGVLTNLSVYKATAKTGNTEYKTEIYIPQADKNPTLEIYVLDTVNKKIPYTSLVSLPEKDTEIVKSEEKINIISEDLTTNILKISGKLDKKNENVFVSVYEDSKKNYYYEDATKSELLNNTENFALFTTDDDGYYSLDLAIKGTTGKYTIKLTGDGISEKKEFNYATLSDKKAILNSLYQNGDYSSLCQPSSSDAGKLGLDTSCFDKINLTNLGNIIATLANSTEKDSEKLNEFLTIYNKALSIEKLNSGLVNDITTLDALSLNNKAVELYNKMNESVKKDISNVKMTGADLLSEEAVNDKFIKEVSLAVINNVANTQNILDVIDNFHSEIGFTNAQYQRYSNLGETLQANLGAEVVKKGGNTSLSAFVTNVMALVDNTVIIIPAPSVPQGGGGGGGGISGATVTGNTESYTPSLNEITYDVFTDLQGFDWAKDAVNSLYNKGIVSGTGTGSFEPQREVKREEFIKMIDTLYEGSYETLEFSDVDSSSWYAPFVIKAVNAGIIKGIDNNTFGTGRGVTREDMAVILVRLLNVEAVASYNSFKDDSDIASYAKDAVYTLKDMGIVSGTGEGNFEPKRIMTRAEAAVVISNFITKLNLN